MNSLQSGQCAKDGAERTIRGGVARFVLLDTVEEHTAFSMAGTAVLHSAPAYLALECMAQLAALHLRVSLDFGRHVFLLSVRQVLPAHGLLQGTLQCVAEQEGISERGALYRCRCVQDGTVLASGDVSLSSVSYSETFPEQTLRPHYERLYQWLLRSQ